ncbi:hypothetical protein ES703_74059 [subsurface metagenome]
MERDKVSKDFLLVSIVTPSYLFAQLGAFLNRVSSLFLRVLSYRLAARATVDIA